MESWLIYIDAFISHFAALFLKRRMQKVRTVKNYTSMAMVDTNFVQDIFGEPIRFKRSERIFWRIWLLFYAQNLGEEFSDRNAFWGKVAQIFFVQDMQYTSCCFWGWYINQLCNYSSMTVIMTKLITKEKTLLYQGTYMTAWCFIMLLLQEMITQIN